MRACHSLQPTSGSHHRLLRLSVLHMENMLLIKPCLQGPPAALPPNMNLPASLLVPANSRLNLFPQAEASHHSLAGGNWGLLLPGLQSRTKWHHTAEAALSCIISKLAMNPVSYTSQGGVALTTPHSECVLMSTTH